MKKIIITGVAQGFGSLLIKKFKSAGYVVGGIDRCSVEQLDTELSSLLSGYWQIDLADLNLVKQKALSVFKDFQPDILINNAGLKFFREFDEIQVEDIVNVINVNYTSPLILTKLWMQVVDKEAKTCVMIASNAAYRGYSKGTLYCSSKSALRVFTQSLKDEINSKKLNVITLCPETFIENKTNNQKDNKKGFSMEDAYMYIQDAIDSGKSIEIPLIRLKSKLHYLIYDIKKYMEWFRVKR